jgi:DNA-binding protein H-NS
MAKEKKQRASKYDEKLAVEGITFDELIGMSANYIPPKKAKKAAKKKK